MFEAVLNEFVDQYHLTLKQPYAGSAYFELYSRSGALILSMNPEGYNLLRNLTELTEALSTYLR